MNQIKPQDRPKVIGLLLAVLAVFCIGGFNVLRMTGALGGSPAPDPSVGQAARVAPRVDVAAADPRAVSGQSALPIQQAGNFQAKDEVVLPNLNNNPFRPIEQDNPAGASAPLPQPQAPPRNQMPPRGAPITMPIFSVPQKSVGPGAPPVLPAPVPAMPLALVGVISGDEAMAMIQVGDRTETVHVGEQISGYRVVRINIDDVTLRRGRTLRILRVGGPASAEVQEASAAEVVTEAVPPVRRVPPTRVAANFLHLELAAEPAPAPPPAAPLPIPAAPPSDIAGPATVPAGASGSTPVSDPITLPLAPGVAPATDRPSAPPAAPPAAGGK